MFRRERCRRGTAERLGDTRTHGRHRRTGVSAYGGESRRGSCMLTNSTAATTLRPVVVYGTTAEHVESGGKRSSVEQTAHGAV